MIINHNISALNTHRQLGANTNQVAKNLEKLSSGLKINRAGDDAAGLAISEKMRAQVRGLEMATKNSQDGISLIQTAEGALQETHAILQRMRELAVQSANDTNMDEVDRQAMQEELEALVEEINDIAERTEFNTQTLIDGSFQNKVFHIGANKGQNITVNIDAMNAEGIGLNEEITVTVEKNKYTTESETHAHDSSDMPTGVTVDSGYSGDVTLNVVRDEAGDVAAFKVGDEYFTEVSVDAQGAVTGTTAVDQDTFDINEKITETETLESVNIGSREAADASIQIIDDAINTVSSQRSKLGAIQNRLEHTINNLGASAENLTAAESRIRDTDMAKEMMEFTKNNILTQSAQAMLAQSQQIPQGVLQLLR